MKKNLRSFAAVALVLCAAVSCQQKEEQQEPSISNAETHEVTFNLLQDLSRTSIIIDGSSTTLTWESTLKEYIHLYENGKEGKDLKLNIATNNKLATLSANFSISQLISSLKYNAVVAADFSNGVATLPSVQQPKAGSFDPAADILVGESKTIYSSLATSSVDLKFARLNAISRLAFTGMTPGEKVDLIKVEAENAIAGPLNPLNDFAFDGYDTANGSNEITLKYDSNNTVADDGTFNAVFTCWAVAPGPMTITVYTDKNTYSKSSEAKGLVFDFGTFKNIKVDLSAALPSSRFEMVTSAPSSWDGSYLIVNTNEAGEAKAFNYAGSSAGYASTVQIVSAENKVFVAANESTKAMAVDVSSRSNGRLDLTVANGKYFYNESGLTFDDNPTSGLILSYKDHFHTFSASGNAVQMAAYSANGLGVTGSASYFGYNGSKFAYSNSAATVYLFKLNDDERQSQSLVFKSEELHFTLADGKQAAGDVVDGMAFTSASKYQPELLSFESSDTGVVTVDANTGKLTIKGAGEAIITATAQPDENYRGTSASYKVTVTVPYYQKVYSSSEIVSGGKYILVSKTSGLLNLLSSYHAFAAASPSTYDFDFSNSLFSSLIYDNGDKIKSNKNIDANQIIIEKDANLISTIAQLIGLKSGSGYTLKPVSVNKYLYCDMTGQIAGTDYSYLTYQIGFSDKSFDLSSINLMNIAGWFNERATIPHEIVFGDNGSVAIRNATSDRIAIGADLRYIIDRYAYVNMSILNSFQSTAELMEYLSKDTQYAWLTSLINNLVKNVSLSALVDYLSADMFIYKYVE